MKTNKKYKRKSVWKSTAIIIIIIIIMASSVLGIYTLVNNHTKNIILANMNQMAEHDMRNIQQFIETRWRRMDMFLEALNDRDVQSTDEVLRELSIKTGTKENEHLFLIDKEGKVYTDQFKVQPIEDNDFMRYFESEDGEHLVFRYVGLDPSHAEPKPHVLYAYRFDENPLTLGEDEPVFVKMVLLEDLGSIQDTMQITSFGEHGLSSVIGRKGNYVVTDRAYTGSSADASFFDRLRNSSLKSDEAEAMIAAIQRREPVQCWCTTEQGVRKFVSVRPLKDYGWSFILSVDESVFWEQTKEHVRMITFIVLVLLTFLLLMFLTVYMMRRKNRKLYFDAAGEVYNKLYYTENLADAPMTALAIVDIDHLKQINDTFGHMVGDWVIKECAGVLQKNVQDVGHTVRFGGDEFVILMEDAISKEDFTELLSNILADIRTIRHENNPNLRITFSIGGYYGKGVANELLQRADLLLYRAKQQRDRIITNLDEDWFTEEYADEEIEDNRKEKILIVDDSKMNRRMLQRLLEDDYEIVQAEDGLEALGYLKEYARELSLILLDIVMPKVNGFEVLRVLNQLHLSDNLPVIVISGETDPDSLKKAYALGVVDYISRPFDSVIIRSRVKNAIKLFDRQKRMALLAANQVYKLETNSHVMVNILSSIMQQRNGESGTHVLHIGFIAELLANNLIDRTAKYPMSREDIKILGDASALHDIGKLAVPEEILNKPGRLTEEEFATIKQHTVLGAEMLKDISQLQEEPLVKMTYEICRWHHERWDGKGYPDGLKGDQIPITAQIVSLADVYDALTSERVYKKAYSHERAIRMILAGECGKFNPLLIECLLAVQERLKRTMEANIQTLQRSQYVNTIVEELFSQDELPATNTVMQLLEHEQIKFHFFNSVSADIQFEQLYSPSILILSKWDADRLHMDSIMIDPAQDERYLSVLGKENLEKVAELVHRATKKSPVVQYTCRLNLNGKEGWYQIVCLTLWDKNQPKTPVRVLGKLIALQDYDGNEKENAQNRQNVKEEGDFSQ